MSHPQIGHPRWASPNGPTRKGPTLRAPPYTNPMKTRAIALTLFSLIAAANTWAAQPPLGSLLACRSIQDDTTRLACFDRESATIAPASGASATAPTAPMSATPAAPAVPAVAAVPSQAPAPGMPSSAQTTPGVATPGASTPGASTATTAAATTPAAAPLDPAATFGLSVQTLAARETAAGLRKKDLQSITAHIARISSAKSGRMVFDLDNHQVWQEAAAEGDLMAKPGDEVKIWRGMMGSFWLQASTGRGCKVTRLE